MGIIEQRCVWRLMMLLLVDLRMGKKKNGKLLQYPSPGSRGREECLNETVRLRVS